MAVFELNAYERDIEVIRKLYSECCGDPLKLFERVSNEHSDIHNYKLKIESVISEMRGKKFLYSESFPSFPNSVTNACIFWKEWEDTVLSLKKAINKLPAGTHVINGRTFNIALKNKKVK